MGKHKCRDCHRMIKTTNILCWRCAIMLDFRKDRCPKCNSILERIGRCGYCRNDDCTVHSVMLEIRDINYNYI